MGRIRGGVDVEEEGGAWEAVAAGEGGGGGWLRREVGEGVLVLEAGDDN